MRSTDELRRLPIFRLRPNPVLARSLIDSIPLRRHDRRSTRATGYHGFSRITGEISGGLLPKTARGDIDQEYIGFSFVDRDFVFSHRWCQKFGSMAAILVVVQSIVKDHTLASPQIVSVILQTAIYCRPWLCCYARNRTLSGEQAPRARFSMSPNPSWAIEDDGSSRVLCIGDRQFRTNYSRQIIELLITRKGPERASQFLTHHDDAAGS